MEHQAPLMSPCIFPQRPSSFEGVSVNVWCLLKNCWFELYCKIHMYGCPITMELPSFYHTRASHPKYYWLLGSCNSSLCVLCIECCLTAALASTHCCYVLISKSCPTLCDCMDCSPPGSSIHGILQARILGWVAIPFSRGSSQPTDRTWVFCIAGIFNASNTSPSFVTTKNVSRHYQMFPYRRQGNSTNYCMIVYWPHSFCNWSHFPFILLYMYGRKKLDKCDSSLLSCFGF